MKRLASPIYAYLRAALLIMLMAAQGVAAAHELEHWDQAAPELCATCSISSGLDLPLASTAPVLAEPAEPAFSFAYAEHNIHCDAPRNFFQRAPPVYL